MGRIKREELPPPMDMSSADAICKAMEMLWGHNK
jgi:hypothetical protein